MNKKLASFISVGMILNVVLFTLAHSAVMFTNINNTMMMTISVSNNNLKK